MADDRPNALDGFGRIVEGIATGIVVAALSGGVIAAVGRDLIPQAAATARDGGYSATWLAAACFCLVLGAWTSGWYFLGPVALTRAAIVWRVSLGGKLGPLRLAYARTLLLGALLAVPPVVLVGLAAANVGRPWLWPSVATWALLTSAVMLVVHLQRRDRGDTVRRLVGLLVAVSVAVTAREAWRDLVGAAVLAALGLIALTAVRRRHRRAAPRAAVTPMWQLVRGAANRWLVGAAIAMLDPSTVAIARTASPYSPRWRLPHWVYRVPTPWALGVVAFARTTGSVALGLAIGSVLALATTTIWGVEVGLSLIMVAQLVVTLSYAGPVMTWQSSSALRRVWPTGTMLPIALSMAALVPAWLVGLVAFGVIDLPVVTLLVLVALPVAVLYRRVTAQSAEGDDALLLATPLGAVPVQVVNRLVAGPDMVVAGILVTWFLT